MGVFETKELAEQAIASSALSGLLTEYQVDSLPYDFDVENGLLTLKQERQKTAQFIQRYTVSSAREHWHYEEGICVA